MALNGIDVSSWQEGINLAVVPCDFVICKATQGTDFVSSDCVRQVEQARSAGKLFGTYHYIDGSGAVAEADYYLANIKNWIGKGILCLDWESNQNSAWGNESYLKQMAQRVIEKTGIPPLIYVQQSRMSAVKPIANELNCGLWIAQYANMNATGYQDSPWNEGAYSCAIRQYSSCGRLSGYSGNLDLNKFYGDATAWGKYANPSGSGSSGSGSTSTGGETTVGLSVNEKAAQIMEHLCSHSSHGYSQPNRAGVGTGATAGETITLSDGSTVSIATGDRDCSSAAIECYAAQGINCGGASYTGNMKSCMVASGNFEALPASTWKNPQRGDILLASGKHTAVALGNGKLGEFLRSENHTIHGTLGDQDGGESIVRALYDDGWDCVLRYIGPNAGSTTDSPASGGDSEVSTGMFGGKYQCTTNGVNIRCAPSTSAEIDDGAKYDAGDTVILDDWCYVADGYFWGRYSTASGKVRYVAVGEAKETLFNKVKESRYNIKVTTDALNVRSGPGTNYYITTTIRDRGVYTIVDESSGTGASKWGKLVSGAGWISLDYVERV